MFIMLKNYIIKQYSICSNERRLTVAAGLTAGIVLADAVCFCPGVLTHELHLRHSRQMQGDTTHGSHKVQPHGSFAALLCRCRCCCCCRVL
jgi:hypothetical protein